MKEETETNRQVTEELPDSWWHKVYVAVVVVTILVIALLQAFTKYFS